MGDWTGALGRRLAATGCDVTVMAPEDGFDEEQPIPSGEFDLILTEGVSYVSERIDITSETIEMLKQLPETSEATQ